MFTSPWLRPWRWVPASLALVVGLYAGAGFWLVPYLLETRLWPVLGAQLGGQWQAADVALNPFLLKLEVRGFALKAPDGRELATVASAAVDVDAVASMRQGALVASGDIQEPRLSVERGKDGRFNFDFLLSGGQSESTTTMPPFRVVRLNLEQGKLDFADRSPEPAYRATLSPLSISLNNLSSLPGETASLHLNSKGENLGELSAEGTLGIAPVVSGGEVTLKGFALPSLAPYLGALAPRQIREGKLSLGLRYRLSTESGEPGFEIVSADGELSQFVLSNGDRSGFVEFKALTTRGFSLKSDLTRMNLTGLALHDIAVQDSPSNPGEAAPAIRIPSVEVGGIALDLKNQALSIEQIHSESAELSAWLSPEGSFGAPGLPPPAPVPAQDTPPPVPAEAGKPWQVKIGEVILRQYQAQFADRSVTPPMELKLVPVNLELHDFSSEASTEFKLKFDTGIGEKGRIASEGKVILRPLLIADLRIAVEQLGIRRFQPYLDKFTRITLNRGRLDLAGDFDFYEGPVDSVRFSGEAGIAGFSAAEKHSGKELANWKDLKLNGLIFETIPRRLSIREVTATEPYANVVIDQDGRLNLNDALASPAKVQAPPEAPVKPVKRPPARKGGSGDDLPVVIGALHINRGSADFADLTLRPIHFAVGIHELSGNVRGLSSQQGTKADVLLEGKIDQNSPVKILGQVNPFSLAAFTDIAMQFRSVNLTTLSPYSGKFAGYRIEKGKMSMDLKYQLDKGRLMADNRFQLDHLTLGEQVESPEATSLPVKLAVALLKDGNGRIDLDLPISGDLSEPDVSIRGLLANAATQLLAKLVNAPFSVLGGIVADGGEELGYVNFDAGSTQLGTPEKDKLAKVSKALKERPALNLEIKGEVNPAQDRWALAEQDLLRQLQSARRIELRKQGTPVRGTDAVPLNDEDYRRLFTVYCRAKTPGLPELRALNGDDALAGKALENAKRSLLEKWSVSELDLRGLAQARGQTVRDYFVKETGMPDERIYLLDVRFTGPEEKEIKTQLSLSGS